METPDANVTPAPRPARAAGATFFTFVARATRSGARLLAFVVVARAYSLDETGQFAYLVVLGSLAGSLADLGLSEYLVRERGGARLVRTTALIRLATLAPAILVAWLIGGLATESGFSFAGLGSVAFGCSGSAVDYLMAEQRSRARYDLGALEGTITGLGPLVPATVAAALGASFDEFQLLLGAVCLLLVVARLGWLVARAGEGRAPVVATVWSSRWFLGRALVAWAVAESPVLYVEHFGTIADVAIFNAALRSVAFLPHPFLAISYAFMPALVHDEVTSRARFHATVKRLNLIVLALLPAALGGCLLLGLLLLRSFGETYVQAWPTLVTLAIAFVLYLGPVNGFPLVAVRRERVVVLTSLVAFVVILAGSIVLMPPFGSQGAAWAMLVGFATAKLLHVATYRAAGLPLGDWRDLALVAITAAWLAASLLAPTTPRLLLLLAGAAASAFLTLRLLRSTVLFERPAHG